MAMSSMTELDDRDLRIMIRAHELLADGVRRRRLRCSGLSLAGMAGRNGMTLDGKDGEVGSFTTLDGLSKTDPGIAVTYLASARFAGSLRSGADVAVVTRPELRGCLQEGNLLLLVEGDPHDCFYTVFAAAVANGNYERLQPFVSGKARIHERAVIGDNVHIEDGAVIDACAVILPNTYVGTDVHIKPNATVGGDGFENAVIAGRRVRCCDSTDSGKMESSHCNFSRAIRRA